ncbi:MAG: hypothetical protein HY791_25685 [Deltaproteobacteria bacterium]|nr:hypothetical protein [Deltaproteobacteria bacterium]
MSPSVVGFRSRSLFADRDATPNPTATPTAAMATPPSTNAGTLVDAGGGGGAATKLTGEVDVKRRWRAAVTMQCRPHA